jgi:hypothetical protein
MVIDDAIVYRADAGSCAATATPGTCMSFDLRAFDVFSPGRLGRPRARHGRWSVLVQGMASVITDPDTLDHARSLDLRPWADGSQDHFRSECMSSQVGGSSRHPVAWTNPGYGRGVDASVLRSMSSCPGPARALAGADDLGDARKPSERVADGKQAERLVRSPIRTGPRERAEDAKSSLIAVNTAGPPHPRSLGAVRHQSERPELRRPRCDRSSPSGRARCGPGRLLVRPVGVP